MTESVSFKAYLKRDGQEVEVRRFGVDGAAATSYMYLRSKIQAMFPSIQNDQFQIFWQDSEKDYVRVDSDEELLEALTSANQQPLKVYVQVSNNSQGGATSSGAGTGTRQTHPGVVCDGCDGAVVGFRYKCGTCPDFDLCSRCENKGLHPEHFMLRMPMPMDSYLAQNHPKFLRKWFSHPYKFHKRHGWTRPASTRGCGDSQNGAGRCPYSRRGEGPGPAAAFAGVTDMFDFGPLMEFIEGLGVAAGEEKANPQASRERAAPSAEQNSSQAPSAAQEPPRPQSERRESSPAAEYLNNIGQMVASILDPLGMPPKKKEQAKAKFVKRVHKFQKCGSKHGWKHGKGLMHGSGKHHHHHWHKHHGHGKPLKHGLGHTVSPKHGHSHSNGHSFIHTPEHSRGGLRLGARFGHNQSERENFPRSGHEVGRKSPELGLKHKHGFAHGPKHGRRGPRLGSILCFGPSEREGFQRCNRNQVQSSEIVSIDDNSDIEIVFEDVGVDVTFDVRTKTSQPQQQQAASTTPAGHAQATATPTPPPAQATATPTPPPAQANTITTFAAAPAQAPTIPTPFLAPAQHTTTTLTAPPVSAQAAPATTPIPAPELVVPSASSQTEVTPAATIETQTEPVRERRNSDDWTLINRESPSVAVVDQREITVEEEQTIFAPDNNGFQEVHSKKNIKKANRQQKEEPQKGPYNERPRYSKFPPRFAKLRELARLQKMAQQQQTHDINELNKINQAGVAVFPVKARSEAMEVDESRGAKPKTPPPSTAQDTPSPSAPPHSDDLSDAERRRIQEAIETFRAMGFNFNTNILGDLLKRENCNILSVLEMMLGEKK